MGQRGWWLPGKGWKLGLAAQHLQWITPSMVTFGMVPAWGPQGSPAASNPEQRAEHTVPSGDTVWANTCGAPPDSEDVHIDPHIHAVCMRVSQIQAAVAFGIFQSSPGTVDGNLSPSSVLRCCVALSCFPHFKSRVQASGTP